MSNSPYARLQAQHFMSSLQDLLGNSQYASLCAGHLEGCTQDLSGNLQYAKVISLYARASAEDLFDYSQDFMSTSPYAREVSLYAHRSLNFIPLPAFTYLLIRIIRLHPRFLFLPFVLFVFIRPIHVFFLPRYPLYRPGFLRYVYLVMKKCVVAVILLVLSLLLSQCYYIRQGVTLIDIYSSGEDIDKALADTALSADEHGLLEKVKAIKHYGVARFGLADNANYTSYIRIDRKYLAAVVSACDRLSFNQYLWNYLFVGRLPYMGFFNTEEAKREGRLLEADGCDVYIRPVDAFSTLGILSDPVFSFMRNYPDYALAELITHEQTHATVFLPGQATFNENLATFVGEESMRVYIREKYGETSDEYHTALSLDHDSAAFTKTLRDLHDRLQALYSGKLSEADKLKEKAAIIASWKEDYTKNYSSRFQTKLYQAFPDRELNNAVIMTNMNYMEKSEDMKALFELCHRDLALFVSIAKKLKPDSRDPLADFKALIANNPTRRESHKQKNLPGGLVYIYNS
jgi:predicted aminopeptidase